MWKPMGVPPGTWSTTGESSKSMLVSSRVTMWWIQLPHPFPDNCIQQDINCGNTASLRYPGLRYHDPQKWICFSSGGVLSHGGIPMSSILIWLSTTSIHLIHMFPLETSGYWGNPIALRNSYCIFFHFVSRKNKQQKTTTRLGATALQRRAGENLSQTYINVRESSLWFPPWFGNIHVNIDEHYP